MQNINQEEFTKLAEDTEYVVLDVRSPQECAEGIIPGSMMLNFLDPVAFQEGIGELDKSKKYLIYCRSGQRSGRACLMMDQLGFADTYNLAGGMLDWTGPVTKPEL